MESTLTTNEILARNKRWRYVRTDRNGTRYFSDYTCQRCGGHGGWQGWPGFTCYECGGTGESTGSTVKVYTPEYAARLAAQREARAKKRQEEREARAIAERGQNLVKAGFGCEDGVYVIYRVVGNTYPIKDELKARGCKFNPAVGWFYSSDLGDHECQRMVEKDVLTDSIFIEWKNKDEVEKLYIERLRAASESTSTWQGEIGDRLELQLHIDRAFEGEYRYAQGMWGSTTTYMYLMTDEAGNKYKWSTSKYFKEGDDLHVRATVKEHSEYKGIKQTVLTRCTKVKE